MAERKPLSKAKRFEVFKRDSFRCQYCGRSAPDVILEVDHIIPVAEGGKNDLMNLITSCRDCNRGKGKRKLTDRDILEKQKAELDALNEKREQMKMMVQWREELSNLTEQQVDEVEKLIVKLTGFKLSTSGRNNMHSLVKRFGFNEVLESTEVAFRYYYLRHNNPDDDDFNYAFNKIGGICYNRIKQGDVEDGNV